MGETEVNAFAGRTEKPEEEDLARALGKSKAVWDGLLESLQEENGVDVLEWKSYSVKHGWALRVLRKKRTVVWMGPCKGSFQVLFILGAKALQAAREAGLPATVVEAMDTAPKYPEGTGVRLQIKAKRDLAAVQRLAAIKIAN